MRIADATGSLETGKQADLILLDKESFAFTPFNDLRRQLVFCENGSSVQTVMVAGRIVCENGKLLTVDEAALKAEIREQWAEYQAQYQQVDHWARTARARLSSDVSALPGRRRSYATSVALLGLETQIAHDAA